MRVSADGEGVAADKDVFLRRQTGVCADNEALAAIMGSLGDDGLFAPIVRVLRPWSGVVKRMLPPKVTVLR
jgi:hypothetical protein